MKTWRQKINQEMKKNKDTSAVEFSSISEKEMDDKFDDDYGGEAKPLRLWTEKYVYFSVEYDGATTCESVPRNPVSDKQWRHIS